MRLFASQLALTLLVIILTSHNIQAQFVDLHLGAGLMNETPGRYQTETGGDKSMFNNSLTLETGLVYALDEDWQISSDFGLLWPGGEETYITRQVFFLNAYLGRKIVKDFYLKLGAGLYHTSLTGEGGTVLLRNGTGSTSFYIPEERSTARNVTFNTSGEYFFTKDISSRVELFLFNPLNSRNRTYNLALTLHYHFGDSLWAD